MKTEPFSFNGISGPRFCSKVVCTQIYLAQKWYSPLLLFVVAVEAFLVSGVHHRLGQLKLSIELRLQVRAPVIGVGSGLDHPRWLLINESVGILRGCVILPPDYVRLSKAARASPTLALGRRLELIALCAFAGLPLTEGGGSGYAHATVELAGSGILGAFSRVLGR